MYLILWINFDGYWFVVLFLFYTDKEVSKEEIEKVENLIQLLHMKYDIAQQTRGLEEIDDELVCTICYANPKSATFHPCQHQSCR